MILYPHTEESVREFVKGREILFMDCSKGQIEVIYRNR